MKTSESILVISALLFATVLYAVIMIRGPRLGIVNKHAKFDSSKLPTYLQFLAIAMILSALFGYAVSQEVLLTIKYVGLMVFIAVFMGINLFLYRKV